VRENRIEPAQQEEGKEKEKRIRKGRVNPKALPIALILVSAIRKGKAITLGLGSPSLHPSLLLFPFSLTGTAF